MNIIPLKIGVSIPNFLMDIKEYEILCMISKNGTIKARMISDRNLTDVPLYILCSSVISLRGLILVLFLYELNNLEPYATEIGNAYLEAYTKEKVYFITGKEFGEM